jgi:hypothetical protein
MKTLLTLSLLGGLALAPHTAKATLADLVCDDSTRLERHLTQGQGAMKLGQGMRDPDALLEIWIAPESGDWTLVQSYANGTSCIVAMGAYWQDLSPPQDPA